MTIKDSKEITLKEGKGEVFPFNWDISNDIPPGEYLAKINSSNGVDETTITVIDDIPKENLWSRYDSAQMPYIGGDEVTEWEDTINGDVADGGVAKYVQGAIGDQPAVEFDGSNTLVANGGGLAQPFHIFVVAQYLSINNRKEVLYSRNDGYECSIGTSIYSSNYEQKASRTVEGGNPNTNPHIFNSKFNGSDSYTRIDGNERLSGDTGGNNLKSISIAGEVDSYYAHAYIGEIAIYEGELSPSKEQKIENTLSNKWSIPVST